MANVSHAPVDAFPMPICSIKSAPAVTGQSGFLSQGRSAIHQNVAELGKLGHDRAAGGSETALDHGYRQRVQRLGHAQNQSGLAVPRYGYLVHLLVMGETDETIRCA